MRPRTLAVLFVVVAALLAFIWFYERDLPSSDERAELATRVVRLDSDEIESVTLSRGESRVRLEREAPATDEGAPAAAPGDEREESARWRLREPLEAAADREAVEALVERLTGLEMERKLEGIDPAEMGLAEPRGRILLETAAGPVELLVGSAVPASSTLIVALAGRDEAYVVSDALWNDLDKPGGDWRSRDLGPDSREAIQRVLLTAGERRVVLGRRGDSFWVEVPYVDRADRDLVSALLGEVTGLRVEKFVDEPDEPAVASPVGVVEVILDGREEALSIEIGGPGSDGELRLARVGAQRFETRTDLATALARAAEEWRSRSWSTFEVYQIDRLEARDGETETVFERDAGDWLRDGSRIAYNPVSDLLYALTGVEAETVTVTAPPAAEPMLTLVLRAEEPEREETLTLYPANADGSSPARVAGRDVTLLLGEGTVADLELKLDEARRAEPPSPADDDVLEAIGED